jgi:hypothetical protein
VCKEAHLAIATVTQCATQRAVTGSVAAKLRAPNPARLKLYSDSVSKAKGRNVGQEPGAERAKI